MKTTVFLGAGASVFAGMPTTKELIENVSNHIKPESWKDPTLYHMCKNIVKNHREKDVEVLYQTIDDMIKAEEMHEKIGEHRVRGDSGVAWNREVRTNSRNPHAYKSEKEEHDDIKETIDALESLKDIIRDTLLDSFVVESGKVDEVVKAYNSLFQHIQHPHRIFTTNYDNVLETYCEQVGLGIINGFKISSRGIGKWDVSTFDDDEYDVVQHGEDDFDRYWTRIRLVKLHGSITWQKEGDDILEIGRPGSRITDNDVMIMPTLGEKKYDKDIFPELWNEFKRRLDEAELLIVIGFSFRDPEINKEFQRRLKHTQDNPMRLLLIDPNPDGLKVLVGDVEPRKRQVEGGWMLDYSNDEMPYVYAKPGEFHSNPHAWKRTLEILDDMHKKD